MIFYVNGLKFYARVFRLVAILLLLLALAKSIGAILFYIELGQTVSSLNQSLDQMNQAFSQWGQPPVSSSNSMSASTLYLGADFLLNGLWLYFAPVLVWVAGYALNALAAMITDLENRRRKPIQYPKYEGMVGKKTAQEFWESGL